MNRRGAEKIGLKRGKMLSEAIDQNLRNFWSSANNKGISKQDVLEEVDNNFQRLSKLTRMEIKGMSRAAKVPYRDLLAFNLFEENI